MSCPGEEGTGSDSFAELRRDLSFLEKCVRSSPMADRGRQLCLTEGDWRPSLWELKFGRVPHSVRGEAEDSGPEKEGPWNPGCTGGGSCGHSCLHWGRGDASSSFLFVPLCAFSPQFWMTQRKIQARGREFGWSGRAHVAARQEEVLLRDAGTWEKSWSPGEQCFPQKGTRNNKSSALAR